MLADIIFLLWVVGAGVLGWKRLFRVEVLALLSLLASYTAARLLAILLTGPLILSSLGPMGTRWLLSAVLWLGLAMALRPLVHRLRASENQHGIRVELDEAGEPVVRGAFLLKASGFFVGCLNGAALYLAITALLIPMIPLLLYKDGRGTVMIHPTSMSLRLLRDIDPDLRSLQKTAAGLRSLLAAGSAKNEASVKSQPRLREILGLPVIQEARKNKKLLDRADSEKQGRRDPTLLLWLPSFQRLASDSSAVSALEELHHAFPEAPPSVRLPRRRR